MQETRVANVNKSSELCKPFRTNNQYNQLFRIFLYRLIQAVKKGLKHHFYDYICLLLTLLVHDWLFTNQLAGKFTSQKKKTPSGVFFYHAKKRFLRISRPILPEGPPETSRFRSETVHHRSGCHLSQNYLVHTLQQG